MNTKKYSVLLITSFCLNLYASEQTAITKGQKPLSTVKSIESSNNTGFKGKIKVVNGYEVAGNSIKGKKIKEEFLTKKDKSEKELQNSQAELIAASKDFTAKAPTLNEKARRDEEKKLAKLDRDLKAKAQELKEELETEMYKKTEELGLEFEKVVQDYGSKEDLDIVIDQSSGRPVYVAERLKCTDDIVTLMNSSYQKNQATSVKPNVTTKKTV